MKNIKICGTILLLIALSALPSCGNSQAENFAEPTTEMINTNDKPEFYDYSLPALNAKDSLHMKDYRGKKVLLVNVASHCGYTPQYEGLQKLYEEYGDKLVIIGFPCNQFGAQEPGSPEEIAKFCSVNYGVSFPLSSKIDVKGKDIHPLYAWLTTKELNGLDDYTVSWNFNKFLVDEEGKLVAYFNAKVKPYDTELLDLIRP